MPEGRADPSDAVRILLDTKGTPEDLGRHLRAVDSDPDVRSILVLACDANPYTPDSVDAILADTRTPVFGGVFPEILHDQARYARGSVVVGLPFHADVTVIRDLSRFERSREVEISTAFPQAPGEGTLFVFVDGLAAHIGALLEGLFDQFGFEISYLGGGGGSLALQPRPCVLSNRGLEQDAAVLAMTDATSRIGVSHGWRPISDALKVTEAEGNRIRSLDWRPAPEVYAEIVTAHAGRAFDPTDVFSAAKTYPFGIAKLGAEVVVRDPIMIREDTLVCVGEVPRGAFVRVLHGDRTGLIEAARDALDIARDVPARRPARLELLVDCISRSLFLEEDFSAELEVSCDPSLPLVGALSIGEIANSGQDYLELYNKTCVIGLL